MIYAAIMSVIKATIFHVQGERGKRDETIYYPIVIFSGNLFEAIVSSVDEIELLPSEHIQVSFNYMLPINSVYTTIWDSQKTFIIDVIHENYLAQFLKIIDEEHIYLAECLEKSFKSQDNKSSS
jgi:hypothetical protein